MTSEPQLSTSASDEAPEISELAALAHALARHARRTRTLGKSVRRANSPQAARPASEIAGSAPNPAARAPLPPLSGTPNARPTSAAPARAPLITPAATSSPASTQAPRPNPTPTSMPTQRTPAPTPVAAAQTARPAAISTGAQPPHASEDPTMAKRVPAISSVQSASIAAAKAQSKSVTPAKTAADVRTQAKSARSLDELRTKVAACEACGLCQTRTQTVFMDGEGTRKVLFVGEAPGADEDLTGVPFVGRAGQLLTDIITKGMGIAREEVFIANVLKCRPPDNREPTAVEKETCTPWLDRQIELMAPEVIIPLGRHAAMHMLGIQAPMGAMRQKVHDVGGRKIVPTFHPAYLLRSPGEKKECWKDIQLAMKILKIDPAPGSKG